MLYSSTLAVVIHPSKAGSLWTAHLVDRSGDSTGVRLALGGDYVSVERLRAELPRAWRGIETRLTLGALDDFEIHAPNAECQIPVEMLTPNNLQILATQALQGVWEQLRALAPFPIPRAQVRIASGARAVRLAGRACCAYSTWSRSAHQEMGLVELAPSLLTGPEWLLRLYIALLHQAIHASLEGDFGLSARRAFYHLAPFPHQATRLGVTAHALGRYGHAELRLPIDAQTRTPHAEMLVALARAAGLLSELARAL